MKSPGDPRPEATNRTPSLLYRFGLIIKGLDGLVELIGGLVLWLVPGWPLWLLTQLERTESDDRTVRLLFAQWAGRLDAGLAAGPQLPIVLFLLSHGIVKIVLVYCLLKEYHWVYPYALGLLGLSALYQLFVLLQTRGLGLALLTAVDLVIVWLVWREWVRNRLGS